MTIDGRLFFINHIIAKIDKDPNATSVKQMQEKGYRKVGVDILGRVSDPKKAK